MDFRILHFEFWNFLKGKFMLGNPEEPELTPKQQEIHRQIDELEASPAFTNDGLRVSVRSGDRRLYEETRTKRDELYRKLCPPEEGEEDQGSVLPAPALETGQQGALESPLWRQKLVEDAEGEMAKLEELGFDPAEIPDDVQPHQVQELKMQRLVAEENYVELEPILEQNLKELSRSNIVPAGKIGAIRDLISTRGIDPAFRNEVKNIADSIVFFIAKANRVKSDMLKTPKIL